MNGRTKEAEMMEMRMKMSEQSAEHRTTDMFFPIRDFPLKFLRPLKNDHMCLFVVDGLIHTFR
jgi:hypothetical protein